MMAYADPAEIRDLEADVTAAQGELDAALRHQDRLARRLLPGRLKARARVFAARTELLRAENALARALSRNRPVCAG